jgi:signal transduction histidine kinase
MTTGRYDSPSTLRPWVNLPEGGGADGLAAPPCECWAAARRARASSAALAAAPLQIQADETKLRQIALNLLGNAIEAARDPDATAATVEVSWTADGDAASLRIDDRGPGIPDALRPRLFEPFVTTRAKGHGLGLAIARSLARAHGGDVELDPRPGGGTSARLTVPIRSQEVAS